MKTYIIGFFATLLPILILDGIWLSVMIKNFYLRYLGDLFAAKPSLAPAAVFYIIYCIGILFFVVFPLLKSQAGYGTIFLHGAFLGLIAYATYDLTNQATLKNWTTLITVTDIVWGAFLTGTAATCAAWILRILKLI